MLRQVSCVCWALLAVTGLTLLCSRPCSAEGGGTTLPFTGTPSDVTAISAGIGALLAANGKNIRNVLSPGGCLDGGFDSDYSQVVGEGFGGFTGTSKCNDVDTACAFTVGYWDTCPGNTPWQRWQLTEGKLYCAMGVKCWGANRCVDAFSVTERSETIACNYDCWGGNGQELVVQFAEKVVANSAVREPVFLITPRFASDKCLTYIGDKNPVRFRPCAGSDDQLWFIPGELPEPLKGIPAAGGRRLMKA